MKHDKQNVPVGNMYLCTTDKNGKKHSFDVMIDEIIDTKGFVKSWRFCQQEIIERNGSEYFLVGEVFLDWLNDSIQKLHQEEARETRGESDLSTKIMRHSFVALTHEDYKVSVRKSHQYMIEGIDSDNFDIKQKLFREMNENASAFQYDTDLEMKFINGIRRYVLRRMDKRTIQDSFFLVDLYELLRSGASVKQCPYCENIFIVRKDSIKYCDICRHDNIPEKLKNRGNEARQIRNKIYKRLMSRDQNKQYYPGIFDAFSFSDVAREYKESHTSEEYLSWLHDVEKATK